jgi:hypothetical protein
MSRMVNVAGTLVRRIGRDNRGFVRSGTYDLNPPRRVSIVSFGIAVALRVPRANPSNPQNLSACHCRAAEKSIQRPPRASQDFMISKIPTRSEIPESNTWWRFEVHRALSGSLCARNGALWARREQNKPVFAKPSDGLSSCL